MITKMEWEHQAIRTVAVLESAQAELQKLIDDLRAASALATAAANAAADCPPGAAPPDDNAPPAEPTDADGAAPRPPESNGGESHARRQQP